MDFLVAIIEINKTHYGLQTHQSKLIIQKKHSQMKP